MENFHASFKPVFLKFRTKFVSRTLLGDEKDDFILIKNFKKAHWSYGDCRETGKLPFESRTSL